MCTVNENKIIASDVDFFSTVNFSPNINNDEIKIQHIIQHGVDSSNLIKASLHSLSETGHWFHQARFHRVEPSHVNRYQFVQFITHTAGI